MLLPATAKFNAGESWNNRTMLRLIALALGLFLADAAAQAPAYPEKPIRLVAGTAPGGITDTLARTSAEGLSARLGWQVVVENKAGATGNLAIEHVAKSPPDGYTLLLVAGGNVVITPFLYATLPFDPLNDIVPVFNIAGAPQLLVVPGTLPVANLAEFIALARANPGKLNYASAGPGSTTHLAADHFARLAGVELVHVPYRGAGPALTDLLAGRVQMLSVGLSPVQAHLKSGALRALAAASKTRLAAAPDVPTSAEAGLPGWEMTTWFGIFAPRGTSDEVVRLLNASMQAVIDDARTRKRMLDSGMEPIGGSAQAFAERVRSDYRAWEQVVKASGVKLE
jgi:tripartite-type tricarboxylate transporter receptor subunit TctC